MASNDQALYEITLRSLHHFGGSNIKRGVAMVSGRALVGTRGGRLGTKYVSFGGLFSLTPIVTATPVFNRTVLNALVSPGIHELTNGGVRLSAHCYRPGVASSSDKLNDPTLRLDWHAMGQIYDVSAFDTA